MADPNLEQRLREAVEIQSGEEADLFFITRDGERVPAHRSIVILQSQFLLEILREHPGHLTPSIQVPSITYSDMCSIISILYTGQAWLGEDQLQLQEACQLLGFHRLILQKNRIEQPLVGSTINNANLNESLIIEETDMKVIDSKDDQKGVKKRGPKSRTKSLPGPGAKASPLKSSSRQSEAVMACKMCPNTSFRGITEFESHLSTEHFVAELIAEYSSRKTKTCVLCQVTFPTVHKLARHIGSDHHKVMIFYERRVEELSELIVSKYGVHDVQCSFCKIKFRNKKLLGTHIGAVHEKFGEYFGKSSPAKDLDFL